MAVSDVVDLMRARMRDNGAEIRREAGEGGLNVIENMHDVVQARLMERDLHQGLWEAFTTDPDGNYAEMIGALEMLVEGDRELAARLNRLLEDYNGLAIAAGTAWQPPQEEAGFTIVGGLRSGSQTTRSESLTGMTAEGHVVDGLPQREDGGAPQLGTVRDDADDQDAAELAEEADRLAHAEALLDMALQGELAPEDEQFADTRPTAGPNEGGAVEQAARAALGADDEALRQLADADRSALVEVDLDDPDLDDSAIDASREASMLSDFNRSALPGGITGEVMIQEGEDLGSDTYLTGRFIPNEDQADEHRPGPLYDSDSDDPISYEQALRPAVLTAGDVDNALEPVRIALDAGEFPEVERATLIAQLDVLRDELLQGQNADADGLQKTLQAIRAETPGPWDMLWWELADLAEDLPPALQAVIKELGAQR